MSSNFVSLGEGKTPWSHSISPPSPLVTQFVSEHAHSWIVLQQLTLVKGAAAAVYYVSDDDDFVLIATLTKESPCHKASIHLSSSNTTVVVSPLSGASGHLEVVASGVYFVAPTEQHPQAQAIAMRTARAIRDLSDSDPDEDALPDDYLPPGLLPGVSGMDGIEGDDDGDALAAALDEDASTVDGGSLDGDDEEDGDGADVSELDSEEEGAVGHVMGLAEACAARSPAVRRLLANVYACEPGSASHREAVAAFQAALRDAMASGELEGVADGGEGAGDAGGDDDSDAEDVPERQSVPTAGSGSGTVRLQWRPALLKPPLKRVRR